MPTVPTLQESTDNNLSSLESSLAQESPLNDKAFLRVLAALLAMSEQGEYKYATSQIKQVLAISADISGLLDIGEELETPRKPAEATEITATLPATTGTVIPASTEFVGDSNDLIYSTVSEITAIAGVATLPLIAQLAGTDSNINDSETLTIGTQIAGATTEATVTETTNVGIDVEAVETYRARLLSVIRGATGGGDANDYKIWAEAVAGVKKAFPYAGKPFTSVEDSYPGDRTIYVLAEDSVDPDGVPPQSLLDEVEAAVQTNPLTGKDRPPLGLQTDTLDVVAIERIPIYVTISSLLVQTDSEAQLKLDISTELTNYFKSLSPFLVGIDFEEDRKDTITSPSAANTVQSIVTSYGGSCEAVTVGLTDSTTFTKKVLDPGIFAKLAQEPVYD